MKGRTIFACDACDTVRGLPADQLALLPNGGEGERDRVRICCPGCGVIEHRDIPIKLGITLAMAGAHIQQGDELAPPDVAAFTHDLEITSFLAPLAGAG